MAAPAGGHGEAVPRAPRRRSAEGAAGEKTRGGWTPAGTAARRRTTQSERGTERGRRTREEIVAAAKRVFERDGYLDVGVDDIVAEAGLARGSFYTYFPTKLQVFKVLAGRVGSAIGAAVSPHPDDPRGDVRAALDRSNRRYLAAYKANAGIYGLVEQLATVDAELHELRLHMRLAHVERVADKIRDWQAEGLADAAVEPDTVAAALVSMTSNLCYWAYVGGERHDAGRLAATVTDLWVRALGL